MKSVGAKFLTKENMGERELTIKPQVATFF